MRNPQVTLSTEAPIRLVILLQGAKYFDHMTNGNNSLLKEALVSEFQLYCRGFPSLASIHTNLFSKLGINIAIDTLDSYNFSGYINSLEISLKEEYQAWFWSTINAEQGTSGKGGNKLRTYARLIRELCHHN